MKFARVFIALLFSVALATGAMAKDRGLNNATKTFTDPKNIKPKDWSDPKEMQRAWLAAIVRVPTGKSRSKRINASALTGWSPKPIRKLPAVVYLHGCSGVWAGTHARVKFMSNLGFVVAAPASFARKKYAQSCDTKTNNADLFRDVIRLRQNDAAYALRQLRKLPYVDPNKIVIMGLSQGAVTTATLRPQPGEAARIIEGWTCHAGWQEYKGLKAKASTPVLSLIGELDPWYKTKWVKGDCGRYMRKNNASRSVVYRSGRLMKEHELLDHGQPRKEVVQFLNSLGLIE